MVRTIEELIKNEKEFKDEMIYLYMHLSKISSPIKCISRYTTKMLYKEEEIEVLEREMIEDFLLIENIDHFANTVLFRLKQYLKETEK